MRVWSGAVSASAIVQGPPSKGTNVCEPLSLDASPLEAPLLEPLDEDDPLPEPLLLLELVPLDEEPDPLLELLAPASRSEPAPDPEPLLEEDEDDPSTGALPPLELEHAAMTAPETTRVTVTNDRRFMILTLLGSTCRYSMLYPPSPASPPSLAVVPASAGISHADAATAFDTAGSVRR